MSAASDRFGNFGFLIKDIGRLYTKLFEYEADHLGITLADAKVLTYLSRNSGINQVQLAELAGIEPMSLVRILDRMEADKWIERRPHPTDRRARKLHLGEQAQPTIDQIIKLSSQVRAQSLTGFKADERNQLIDLLERVHVQLLQMISEQKPRTPTRAATGENAQPRLGRKRALPGSSRVKPRTTNSRTGKTQRAAR
jgi:MarR family transcriptional regulator for hemolysin